MERSSVFPGGLGFEINLAAIHQTDAVGDAVVALELLSDDGSLDGGRSGDELWGPAEDGFEGDLSSGGHHPLQAL